MIARQLAAGAPHGAARRQDLVRLHTAVEVARLTAARAAAGEAVGAPLPGAANIAKLWAGEIARRSAALALDALGGRGTLHDYAPPDASGDVADEAALVAAQATAIALAAPAVSLVGGVDMLQTATCSANGSSASRSRLPAPG